MVYLAGGDVRHTVIFKKAPDPDIRTVITKQFKR
jgi:hypothetical protein